MLKNKNMTLPMYDIWQETCISPTHKILKTEILQKHSAPQSPSSHWIGVLTNPL